MESSNTRRQALITVRRNLPAKIKTVEGGVLRGIIHLRQSLNRFKDELNEDSEHVVALTNVVGSQGNALEHTFLVPYDNIIYLAVEDPGYEARHRESESKRMDSRILPKRKVKAVIRLSDRSVLFCCLFVRNTVQRAKDEINSKEGRFIVVGDVQEQNSPPEEKKLTYFINKQHIVYYAVNNDYIE